MEIDLSAQIGGFLGRMHSTLDRMEKQQAQVAKWLQATSEMPKYNELRSAGTADTNGYAVIEGGGPTAGRRWVVRNVVVGGTTWGASVNGTAVLVVQAAVPTADTSPNTVNVWDSTNNGSYGVSTNTLPSAATYGHGELIVKNPARLWVIIYDGTSGTDYAAAIRFVDEPMGS